MAYEKTLEGKLNFINDAKKSNIAKINVESVNFGRANANTIIFKRNYELSIH